MLIPKDTGFMNKHGDPIMTGDWFILNNGFYRVNGTPVKPILAKLGKYGNDDIPLADAIEASSSPDYPMIPLKFNGTKRCPQCGETKPYSEFSIDFKRKGIHSVYCRDCIKARQMGYHTPPEKKRAQKALK